LNKVQWGGGTGEGGREEGGKNSLLLLNWEKELGEREKKRPFNFLSIYKKNSREERKKRGIPKFIINLLFLDVKMRRGGKRN